MLSEGVAEGEGKDLGPVPVPLREGFGPVEVDGNDLSEERKSELETSAGRRPESSAGEVVGITLEEPPVKEGDGPELTEKQRRGILDGSSEQGSSSKRLSLFVGADLAVFKAAKAVRSSKEVVLVERHLVRAGSDPARLDSNVQEMPEIGVAIKERPVVIGRGTSSEELDVGAGHGP